MKAPTPTTVATFTRVTSHKPQRLTKQLSLTDDGHISTSAGGNMVQGRAVRVSTQNAQDLADVIDALEPNQALIYGCPELEDVAVYSQKEYDKLTDKLHAIPRKADRFTWPTGPGVLMLDYDPRYGIQPMGRDEFRQALRAVLPDLDRYRYVTGLSSSSLIYNGDTQLNGIRGQRAWLMIADATDIPRAGQVLYERFWLAGHGYYNVSKSGALLERSLIDSSVWQTNRLDFAAGAQCVPPLEQRRGKAQAYEGELIDTRQAIPDLTAEEQATLIRLKEEARAEMADEAQAVAEIWAMDNAERHLDRLKLPKTDENLGAALAIMRRAANQHILTGDFTVTLDDGAEVTIAEILDDPEKYHQRKTLDPLEPDYQNRKVVGILYLYRATPILHSFARGKQTYRLFRQPRRIEHKGGHTRECTDETLRYMRLLPDCFDMGTELVAVRNGDTQPLDRDALGYWLGGVSQYFKMKKERDGSLSEVDIDPPMPVIRQMIAQGSGRRLRTLNAVITAPVITAENRVVGRVGYDEGTQLFLDSTEEPAPIPTNITDEQLEHAVNTLWEPFEDFKTATPVDRGVLLCAALTAIQRPMLKTAPAFGLDAPVQGTGKTYLGQCLGALAQGEVPPVWLHITGMNAEEEIRKRLMTILVGGARVILWDNVLGSFDSTSLAGLTTSETMSDRILGETRSSTVLNKALLLFSGNNLTLAGDMPRRVLKCRLDAQVQNPATLRYQGNPLNDILTNRQRLVQAGLTIIRAWLESIERQHQGSMTKDSTASFEEWDHLCRQPVAWLEHLGYVQFADPGIALRDAMGNDPEAETLGAILRGAFELFGSERWTTRELLDRAMGLYGAETDLTDALKDLSASGNITARGIGRALSYRKGRIVDGKRLDSVRAGGVTFYFVERIAS